MTLFILTITEKSVSKKLKDKIYLILFLLFRRNMSKYKLDFLLKI